MGKTMNQIYMDYQAMEQKASRLEELAREIRSVAENQIEGCMNNRGIWEGDSGDAFRQKVTRLNYKITRRAEELEKTASAIRVAAQRQYRLEKALIEIVSH